MTHIESAEAAGGRLGAVLASAGQRGPVRLSTDGPWLATTLEQARAVLTDPASFDFPSHVGRGTDLDGSVADTRSGHSVFAPTTPEDVARGMAVFTAEWDLAVADGETVVDAMQILRRPVARATCAAVLPHVAEGDRHRIAELVLAWIDALGPVIAAARPPRRFSRVRRQELRASAALEQELAGSAAGTHSPQVLATMLAAGIQVPIAAGSWLLVWSAAHPELSAAPDHVVWETLRLTPPTWITARLAVSDVRVGDQEVAAGSLVLVSPLLLGRLPALVPGADEDRDAFDPDRWTTDRARPGAWLPFGAGPHACPGRTLGLAMLRHLAEWAAERRPRLVEPVRVDQSRGVFPSPAILSLSRDEGRP